MESLIWRSAVKATAGARPAALTSVFVYRHQITRHASSATSVLQPSFWKGMIPKPFRRGRSEQSVDWSVKKKPKSKSKDWNPATFFIIIFLFIGSMSIQMIALRKDFDTFMRRSEVHIGLLREVVEKLQRGEEVDVEKTLGTGDAEKEKEWEEALKELECDDIVKNAKTAEKTKSTPTFAKAEAIIVDEPQIQTQKNTKTGVYSNFF
ncbi:uncharacterized protein F4822DRAFT_15781 [Hypoxylon trugodes]|uniref:uncharacterized protein n=1 Tax=Hypoxylon trugodes TaxID=326681 RepID=UPI00219D4750|nr:uncharacterized protein F4822DRAFT_15781 [Hypoxylon trugodes]KAI1393527.1 hypothetical protein F4822DRAFT_15781 [Hypoxylon trugodes]